MWQQVLGHMASLEHCLPRGRTRMHPLHWHLKDCWSLMVDDPADQIPLAGVHRGGPFLAPGGQMVVQGTSSGSSPVPVVLYRYFSVGLRGAPVGPDDLGGPGPWKKV